MCVCSQVLAVNSQEDALCHLIQLAYDRLDGDLLRDCFTSQAVGGFFWGKPMNTYGGSPVRIAGFKPQRWPCDSLKATCIASSSFAFNDASSGARDRRLDMLRPFACAVPSLCTSR